MSKRIRKTARILTIQATDGMGAVQLIDNADGRIVTHHGYCHAAEWNWNHEIVVNEAAYLGYKVTSDERQAAPELDEDQMGEDAAGDRSYQLAMVLVPEEHDYQLGLGI